MQEERRRELQTQLRDASRDAGMAEVATGVLHSVGNVLNSLGVSASLVQTRLRNSRTGNVRRIASLLAGQGDQLGAFLTNDAGGRQIPTYLAQLGETLDAENQRLQTEAEAIATHVGHIRAIHFTANTEVSIRREYQAVPAVTIDRHKLIQILGNLLSNARHALKDRGDGPRVLTVRICVHGRGSLALEIEDSGTGISSAALEHLFEFGFTTKKDGHGFGLHTSAILAKEIGGDLTGHSEGPGRGARFVLRLPLAADATVQRKQA
jgi:signal transduction histidine kinase